MAALGIYQKVGPVFKVTSPVNNWVFIEIDPDSWSFARSAFFFSLQDMIYEGSVKHIFLLEASSIDMT